MASCLLSGFEKRREVVENSPRPLPAHGKVALKKWGPRGGRRGLQPQPVCGWLLIPGLNHIYCFLAGEDAGSGEKNPFLDRQDQEMKQE